MFRELLSKALSLYIYYQNAHWIVSKQSFHGDHVFLKGMYEEANGLIDTIGEKALGVTGDTNLVKMPEVMKLSYQSLSKLPYDSKENIVYFQELLKMEDDFCKFCEKCEKEQEYTLGTRNMLADMADASEGRQYLLKQRIGKQVVKVNETSQKPSL